jgi:hypothetical protein
MYFQSPYLILDKNIGFIMYLMKYPKETFFILPEVFYNIKDKRMVLWSRSLLEVQDSFSKTF